MIEYRVATTDDHDLLMRTGDLLDFPPQSDLCREFLDDPRHHLLLALDGDQVVGIASGVHYVHPDKKPQMFINEVSVLKSCQNRGIGRTLVKKLSVFANEIGCSEAWVLTEDTNQAAMKSYIGAGGVEEPNPIRMFTLKPFIQ